MLQLSNLHYFEVNLSGESAGELRSSLVRALHGYNAHNGNPLGLDVTPAGVRVFGEAQALTEFYQQPRIRRLVTLADGFSAPAAVPATDTGVCVMRHRAGTRQQPARLRRFAQRNPGVQLGRARVLASDASVGLESQSNGEAFLLKLSRTTGVPSTTLQFNSYGLCANGTCLPAF